MVLGAGVNSNGTPSEVLRKRLDKAVELYAHNPGSIILVTGDNRVDHYNEPEAMQRYLVSQGIPVASVVQDYAGRRTLDSCWRARNVFKAKDITIVTQAFHMPRSVFLCRSVGLQTRSAIAQDGGFETRLRGVVREVPSSVLAVGQVLLGWRAEIAGDGSELDLSRV